MIKIVITGVAGRMGGTLARLVLESEDLDLVGATEKPDHPAIGSHLSKIVGETISEERDVLILDNLDECLFPRNLPIAQVVLDFTAPEASVAHARVCAARKVALVSGTTGLDQEKEVTQYAASIPVVRSPNFSMGVNLLWKLVGEAARILGEGYDVEIIEAHHHFKRDAPSGTARALAKEVIKALDWDPDRVEIAYGRSGAICPRAQKEIGIHSIRGGDIPGEHTVLFSTGGERIELTHKASGRETFAQGALQAARWVIDKEPGLYTMKDVLGLK